MTVNELNSKALKMPRKLLNIYIIFIFDKDIPILETFLIKKCKKNEKTPLLFFFYPLAQNRKLIVSEFNIV